MVSEIKKIAEGVTAQTQPHIQGNMWDAHNMYKHPISASSCGSTTCKERKAPHKNGLCDMAAFHLSLSLRRRAKTKKYPLLASDSDPLRKLCPTRASSCRKDIMVFSVRHPGICSTAGKPHKVGSWSSGIQGILIEIRRPPGAGMAHGRQKDGFGRKARHSLTCFEITQNPLRVQTSSKTFF